MDKIKTAVVLSEATLLRAERYATRTGRSLDDVVEGALREYLRMNLPDRVSATADIDPDAALALAVEETHLFR